MHGDFGCEPKIKFGINVRHINNVYPWLDTLKLADKIDSRLCSQLVLYLVLNFQIQYSQEQMKWYRWEAFTLICETVWKHQSLWYRTCCQWSRTFSTHRTTLK